MARPAASPEQRDRQRRRIRRAAAEVYAEKGLLGVTVRGVAVRAGVSTGTIYSYFANLQELMRSLWQEPVAAANHELEATAREHPDPIRRIRALLETYVAFAKRSPDVYRGALMLVRPESLPRPSPQPLAELPFHRLLCEALREGQQAGAIRDGDVGAMAQVLWSGLHGAIALPISVDLYAFDPPDRLVAAMIETLLAAIETRQRPRG